VNLITSVTSQLHQANDNVRRLIPRSCMSVSFQSLQGSSVKIDVDVGVAEYLREYECGPSVCIRIDEDFGTHNAIIIDNAPHF
jgi:hypothetical protein